MRENRCKRMLLAGEVPIGTGVFEFSSTGIARLAAAAGADFVMIDMEHTGWGMDTLRTLLAASRAADCVPMVRVPAAQGHFISRVLDLGAMGIMVPMVESEEQARTIADAARYPPQGRRGTCFGIGHDDYRDGDIAETMRSANAEVLVIAQIETVKGLEAADRIAALAGIDVLWVGHFDLTTSMGIPGQFDHPRYRDALRAVVAACERHGKGAGFMVASPEQAAEYAALGFRVLMYWADLWIYRAALKAGVGAARERVQGLPRRHA